VLLEPAELEKNENKGDYFDEETMTTKLAELDRQNYHEEKFIEILARISQTTIDAELETMTTKLTELDRQNYHIEKFIEILARTSHDQRVRHGLQTTIESLEITFHVLALASLLRRKVALVVSIFI
jgi:hypothetical protein